MAQINQITHWRAPTALAGVYDQLLDAGDSDAFGPIVLDAVTQLAAGVRRLYLFESSIEQQNQLHYHFCEPYVEELFPTYSKWYLREDPIRDAYRAASASSDIVLQRIQPDDISSANFRQQFFDAGGIVERISIVQKDRDVWRGMSVARHESQGCFSDDELTSLVGLAFLALPLIARRQRRRQHGNLSVEQLETRFATRFSQLTSRERQVCARAVIGMTVEATAQDLGIAKTSVLTYRQRAYLRLNVKSPLELSSLVVH